ncbi:hypothetical protein B0H19DRAFT_1084714 [Mycena capillaripes]|nr:hypothetical protein B0H19DRAFT_1084714 [Mycena capillaripes]
MASPMAPDPLQFGPDETMSREADHKDVDMNDGEEKIDFTDEYDDLPSVDSPCDEGGELESGEIDELTGEQIEGLAHAETMRGGEQEQYALLDAEVKSLRVERDLAKDMGERAAHETRKLRLEQEMMNEEIDRERGQRFKLENELHELHERLRQVEKRPQGRRSHAWSSENSSVRSTPEASRAVSSRPRSGMGAVSTAFDVEVGLITTTADEPPMDRPPTGGIPRFPVMASRPAMTEPKPSKTVAPPQQYDYPVDKRGFPTDARGWQITHQLQLESTVWVHAFRHLFLWAYARAKPPSQRSVTKQLTVDYYVMPDWVSKTLSVVYTQRNGNLQAIQDYARLRRETIQYDPELLAQWMQYRETSFRGCLFTDDCFTLNARNVRGLMLFDATNLAHKRMKTDGPLTETEKLGLQPVAVFDGLTDGTGGF